MSVPTDKSSEMGASHGSEPHVSATPLTRREARMLEAAAAQKRPLARETAKPKRVTKVTPSSRTRSARPSVKTSAAQPARFALSTMVVAGLVATLALPAYALAADGQMYSAAEDFNRARAQAQGVDVSVFAGEATLSSEAYTSETKAQIEQARVAAQRAAVRAYTPPTQSSGDDYPFWNQTPDDFGGGLSSLGYFYRECVDFVAWRLNRDAGSTGAPWRWTWSNLASGSAYRWLSEWQRKGWFTSGEPVAGAVAWFPYNHVAYVKAVNGDGTVTIEEYNQQSDHLYHQRVIPVGDAIYLYPPG